MYLAHERYLCKSIHHMGSDRTSCRMRIALGENHRGSGVTLKDRVTWDAVSDSLCTGSSTPVDKPNQGQKFCGLEGVKSGQSALPVGITISYRSLITTDVHRPGSSRWVEKAIPADDLSRLPVPLQQRLRFGQKQSLACSASTK